MQMKLLSAAAALAVAFAGSAYAQSTPSTGKRNAETPKVDRKAKNAEEERIEADAKAAKAKCEPMKGNEKDLCQAEAKAKEKVAKAERRQRANEALSLVRLDGFGDRKPAQLSGGQRQRVALARAIVNTQQALLLDEPLGALDLKLRQELQIELKQLQQRLGMTFVYVTHDQEEALTMSDRIAVFNEGKVEQVGTPAEMYEHPATEFVAGFIGTSNVIERDGRTFTVRPEKIRLLPDTAPEGEPGVVRAVAYLGSSTKFVVALDAGGELTVLQQNLETSSEDVHGMEGRRVRLSWRRDVEFAIEEEGT